jgi:hypothetical protein
VIIVDKNGKGLKKIVPINVREFDEKSDEAYENLKPELEKKYHGRIVAIEPYSGDYFVGNTVIEAGDKAKAKYPDKIFYFVRPGFRAVYRDRGRVPV